jgi:hypothetical protein
MFKEAVAKGDITWHAGPMNMQIENMNELLLGLSLNISTDLDSMFGINRKHRVLRCQVIPPLATASLNIPSSWSDGHYNRNLNIDLHAITKNTYYVLMQIIYIIYGCH